ncbi:MAG: peptidylprolyl isomerase [Phycisphaerales bacterium]|nr:peptidylprolyl isomerase [Phycisphaerales bacterium]
MNLLLGALALCACAGDANAMLEATRVYFGIHESMMVRVEGAGDEGHSLALIEGGTGRVLGERLIEAGEGGMVDLSSIFGDVLGGVAQREVVYAQEFVDGDAVGAPLVIEPMVSPRVAMDGRTAAILAAFNSGDRESMNRLLAMSQEQSDTLAGQVVWRDPAVRVCAGFRVYRDRFVEVETSLGIMTFAMRPDAAPNTCFEFLELVEGGFYTGVPFHRIVPTDRYGRAFVVQAGDPGGTGDGTPGFSIDFEESDLPHAFGVVSMARELDDPNSNGSQFFIGLSREGCARLDGRFVAFGEVVGGADVLNAIAAVPVGLRDPEDASSAMDRPLDPPMILSARTVDATPITARPARVTREEAAGVER